MIRYHYICAKWGIDNICRGRLKVARFEDANDPFELEAFYSPDRFTRTGLRKARHEAADSFGFLCFSETWRSPVMWSHYADRHRGLCLGFDIPESHLLKVEYSYKRIASPLKFDVPEPLRLKIATSHIATKFAGWSYEREWRCISKLSSLECDDNGKCFVNFDEDLVLKKVFIGCQSKVTTSGVTEALGEMARTVAVIPTRLAFKSFRVVTQRNK